MSDQEVVAITDAEFANTGGPEHPAPDLEVNVSEGKAGTFLSPVKPSTKLSRYVSNIRQNPDDVQMAQIVDADPAYGMVIGKSDRLAKVSKREAREALVWYQTPGGFSAAFGDRILVRRDTIEDAYSCETCHGKGRTEIQCSLCAGTAKEGFAPCRMCKITPYGMQTAFSCGFKPCASCRGVGWAGGIVIPDVAQSIPIAGIVVSVGPDTTFLKLGDRVMFSRFAGHTWDHRGGECTVMMREHEILTLLTEAPFQE